MENNKKSKRADQLVFDAGLTESREQAKRFIMAGKIYIIFPNSDKLRQRIDKPGQSLPVSSIFELDGIEKYVSRGAYKLLTALDFIKLEVKDFVVLDAGASTGGFSDCLLQEGAAKVYAVDVGRNQLHEKLKSDPRVVSMEGVNLRTCSADLLPEKVDLLVADLSFISLTLVLPACVQFLKDGAKIIALIKPQFELGPGSTDKGIVRDPEKRQEAVDTVVNFAKEHLNFKLLGIVPSALKGAKGNQEFLACWVYEKNI